MTFKLPVKYKLFGVSNNGNTVTFSTDTGTVSEPRLLIVSRVLPTWQRIANAMGWSVPSYRIRVQHGVLNADGSPIATRVGADLTLRWPQGHGSSGAAVVTDLVSVLSAVDFATAVFGQQLLPQVTEV